jgi:hypothetical protein
MKLEREFYIPKPSTKVADKLSDAVAYIYATKDNAPAACVFYGKQSKPVWRYRFRNETKREAAIREAFKRRRLSVAGGAERRAEAKVKAAAFAAEIQVGDIFHHSYGYDETHHVYHEVVAVKGRFAEVRPIAQAQKDLGYDYRHRCMPQSGAFTGPAKRVLIQDGRILVDQHYHASKWNTSRVAGVAMGPAYTGGGMH